MGLFEVLEKIDAVKPAISLALVFGTISGVAMYQHHVKKNLESDAMVCNFMRNTTFPMGRMALPLIRNKDIDGDGRYESAMFYRLGEKTMCQEITVGKDGTLIFHEPTVYK